MADGPTPAVALMVKAEQDRKSAEKRIAEARKVAAGELGEVVIAAGAHLLPPRELKALLAAIMTLGPVTALEQMTSSLIRRPASGSRMR